MAPSARPLEGRTSRSGPRSADLTPFDHIRKLAESAGARAAGEGQAREEEGRVMLRRFLYRLQHRLRRIRGRFAARAIMAAFPELLTFDPARELKSLLEWVTP